MPFDVVLRAELWRIFNLKDGSFERLTRECEISRQRLINFMHSRAEPGLGTIVRLCDALGLQLVKINKAEPKTDEADANAPKDVKH